MKKNKQYIACWWSGGVTSAVAVKKTIELYGKENCRILFIDTKNEHDDTYRFLIDCEKWYGMPIETITGLGQKYKSIADIWREKKTLNSATGAICSSELKRKVREKYQKQNPEFIYNVFGYDLDEAKRAKGMTMNNPKVKAIYPLMMFGLFKKDCIKIIEESGIKIPIGYYMGFLNNNCLKTGCVQGGIGYWQKWERDDIELFNRMADLEHELTDLRGFPVTMLKDQSNESKEKLKIDKKDKSVLVFLKPHPKYSNKSLIDMPQQKVEPLIDCNGYCGTYDLEPKMKEFAQQINFQIEEDVQVPLL